MKTHLLPSALAYLLFPSSALFSPVSSATIQPVANLGRLRSDHSVECTEDTTWTAEQIPSKKNCAAAVAKVREEYDAFGTDEFEFLAPGTLPKSGRPLQKTPRKFQAGDCEVAIAMTKTFKPGTLPGKAPGRLPSDITTWEKIFNGVEAVRFWCTDRKQYGWYPVGQGYSIGLFMWEIGSDMEKAVFSNGLLSSNTTMSK